MGEENRTRSTSVARKLNKLSDQVLRGNKNSIWEGNVLCGTDKKNPALLQLERANEEIRTTKTRGEKHGGYYTLGAPLIRA